MLGRTVSSRVLLAIAALAASVAAGCADKQVTLNYAPPADLGRIPNARALTIFAFEDRRGDEGDQDPYRVGGVYHRYGSRLAKVMVARPFARTLAEALGSAFKARGVETLVAEDRQYRPGVTPVTTPFALAGEIRDFSTEARFTNSGHVAGIVRLYTRDGGLLLEKEVSERDRQGIRLGAFGARTSKLEKALNEALAKFVERVARDPDVAAALSAPVPRTLDTPPGRP